MVKGGHRETIGGSLVSFSILERKWVGNSDTHSKTETIHNRTIQVQTSIDEFQSAAILKKPGLLYDEWQAVSQSRYLPKAPEN